MKATTLAWVLGTAAALSACGGGGGGGDDGSPASANGGSVQAPPSGTAPSGTAPSGDTSAGQTPGAPANGGTSADPGTPGDSNDPAASPAPGTSVSPTDPSGTSTAPGSTVPGGGTPSAAVDPTAPVTDVPTPTYAAGSLVASAFKTLNDERARCGFGKVAQNAQLDSAAARHTAYLQTRWNEGIQNSGHLEDPGLSGYTAITPAARAAASGFSGSVGEYLSYHYHGAPKDYGDALVRTMLASVYNQIGMLDGQREVGASAGLALQSSPPIALLTWLNGTQPGVPLQDVADVVSYPCDGTSGVQPYMYRENPDPFAMLGLAIGNYVGHPLYFRAPSGKRLRLAGATMTDAAGNTIPVALYHAEQDPLRRLTAWQAFVVPRVELKEGARYTVQVEGTSDGVAFTRRFSFSTLTF